MRGKKSRYPNVKREERRTDDVQREVRQGRRKRGDKRAVGHEY